MTALVLVAAVALDSALFMAFVLPLGAEANSLVLAIGPEAALAIRWSAVAVAIVAGILARRYRRYLRPMMLLAATLSTYAAGTELAVVWP